MTTLQHILATAVVLAAGAAQASEITEFPVSSASSVSRAEVKAQARAANDAGQLRYDFTGPADSSAAEAMSQRSRVEVRREAMTRDRDDAMHASDFVGGM